METINTLVVENSIYSDITLVPHLYVEDNIESVSYYRQNATSNSNSNLSWTYQSPGFPLVLDRNVLINTKINITLTITNVPVNSKCIGYANTEAFQSFPFNRLVNQASSTVNNEGSSFSSQFYLDEVLRSTNPKYLSQYNSFCPTLSDKVFGMYTDGVGTMANVLASASNYDYDSTFVPRGATPNITFFQIDRYVGGVYTDNSATSTATTNVFKVSIQLDTTEPLVGLAPFDWENSEQNKGGLLGINGLNVQFTMDTSCS